MCPRCGYKFVCGCGSKVCKERGRGKQLWPWINGEVEACGHCGLQASADQWFDEQMYSLSDREGDAFKHPRPSLSDYLFRPGKRNPMTVYIPHGSAIADSAAHSVNS